jgi:hypothetical protein
MTPEIEKPSRQPAIPRWLRRVVLKRRVHLPNFLPSTIPVLAMIFVGWWDKGTGDMVIAWFGIGMLVLLALTGVADIMANHYREKLTRNRQVGGYHLAWDEDKF